MIASALRTSVSASTRTWACSSPGCTSISSERRVPDLRLLMAVVATVLAIACVNLAGLLMARGIGRRGELAVRAALGASRGRLVRQLVIESLVLSSCGGAAGLAIAYWATQALVTLTAGALTAGTPSRSVSMPVA